VPSAIQFRAVCGFRFDLPCYNIHSVLPGVLAFLAFLAPNLNPRPPRVSAATTDRGDHYDPAVLRRLEYFLRDHRTGRVHPYDPRVFDLLHDLTGSLGRPGAEIDVVCGYRTRWSNNYLRSHSSAVAGHSLHMQAMAIDIRVPGVETAQLRDAALSLHRGGVGYYRREQFVHVDVGRVRRW
jgi:uncharacterized protein YcbK (DUF882 family)